MRPAEKSPGPDDEHHHHHQIDEGHLEFREDDDAHRLQSADEQRSDERPPEAPQPPDHHDHKRFNDDFGPQTREDRADRTGERPGKAGEHGAKGKYQGEEGRHIDAESIRHLPVGRSGAHHLPGLGMDQKIPHGDCDQGRHYEHQRRISGDGGAEKIE